MVGVLGGGWVEGAEIVSGVSEYLVPDPPAHGQLDVGGISATHWPLFPRHWRRRRNLGHVVIDWGHRENMLRQERDQLRPPAPQLSTEVYLTTVPARAQLRPPHSILFRRWREFAGSRVAGCMMIALRSPSAHPLSLVNGRSIPEGMAQDAGLRLTLWASCLRGAQLLRS